MAAKKGTAWDKRPAASSKRRWKGRPRQTVWCAFKDCGVSLPPKELFCVRHAREALKILNEHGVLRPFEDLVPITPKKEYPTGEE
jgi:hypothetical protein